MFNIILACGSIGFTLALTALTMLLMRVAFLQKIDFVKRTMQLLGRYHKYIGGGALLFGTVHGSGMLYFFRDKLNQNFIWAGGAALLLFWTTVAMSFTMKRVAPEKKKRFLTLHKGFAVVLIAAVLIHIVLLPS